MAYTKICGIYCITNVINKKKYIGSSKNLKYRFYHHKYHLAKGTHHNTHLQKSWNKYGECNFIFNKLSECDESLLLVVEQYYINLFKTYDKRFGYNIERFLLERKRSEYTKKKISSSGKGRIVSKETRDKLLAHPNALGKHQLRKTHCPYGHPYSGDNLIIRKKDGWNERKCRACEINYGMKTRDAKNPNRIKLDQTKEYCCHGHCFDEKNTYYRGSRRCCHACKNKKKLKASNYHG